MTKGKYGINYPRQCLQLIELFVVILLVFNLFENGLLENLLTHAQFFKNLFNSIFREELKIFSGEVVRFGNRLKDPQWHNLERYFQK